MGYWNNGELRFPAKKTDKVKEVINDMVANHIIDKNLLNAEDDVFSGTIIFGDVAGDIEDNIRSICRRMSEENISLNGSIEFTNSCDDSSGRYDITDSTLEVLDEKDVLLRGLSDEELKTEIRRREIKPYVVNVSYSFDSAIETFICNDLEEAKAVLKKLHEEETRIEAEENKADIESELDKSGTYAYIKTVSHISESGIDMMEYTVNSANIGEDILV